MRLALSLILLTTCFFVGASSSSEEQVEFTSSDGFVLEGTLYLPDASSSEQTVPGVVLVHGSGAIDRNSIVPGQLNLLFGFDVSIFADIAKSLQEAGIAVLTYDKRNCYTGHCENNNYPAPSLNMTIYDFVADALAAVEHLQTRTEVNDITVVGHSESGQYVTVLLEENPEITNGVLMSGPFHPIDYMFELQLNTSRQLLQDLGVNESVAAPILAPLEELVQGLKEIRAGSNITVGGTPAATWWTWFDIREDALEAATKIDQPLLVLGGELDANVPPSEAEAWSDYLTQVGADYEVKILPCVTHAMNCLAESDPTQLNRATDIGRNVDSQVTDALIVFVAGEGALDTSEATSEKIHLVLSTTILAGAIFLMHL